VLNANQGLQIEIKIAAHLVRMFLSVNAEVAFPSRTTTIAAAANLPTPATSANVADVAASMMSAFCFDDSCGW
jgi:hypothetical protein